MSQAAQNTQVFSLQQVMQSIKKTLHARYTSSFWVKAEFNKLNFYKHSGHCYPEIVEKKDGKIVAQAKGIIWKDDFLVINQQFLNIVSTPLQDGIKVLFRASISFDSAYGLALHIQEIDPAFTLGDLEREKQESILALQQSGLYALNKTKPLPLFPTRLAIISVETSKGYADFIKVLKSDTSNYPFFTMLFPALLQGDKAADDIVLQLQKIKKVLLHFDAVAIIRGGGGDVGLSCYNNFSLATTIASFPIPVLTGIGHATNLTVSEMVAHYNAITPTKLAEHLLQKCHAFAEPVLIATQTIANNCRQQLSMVQQQFTHTTKFFKTIANSQIKENKMAVHKLQVLLVTESTENINDMLQQLLHLSASLQSASLQQTQNAGLHLNQAITFLKKDITVQHKQQLTNLYYMQNVLQHKTNLQIKDTLNTLNHLKQKIAILSPENILKRGFSITLLSGKALTQKSETKKGDTVTTILANGEFKSTINE